jgi:hypothetical protein
MKVFKWFNRRYRAWRRKHKMKAHSGALREFIYLDDVSVYSLLGSRGGPIASEFTESQSRTLESEANGGLELGSSSKKVSLGGRLSLTRVSESQVVRKAIIQTTFKELFGLIKNDLIFKADFLNSKPPALSKNPDWDLYEEEGWLYDTAKLKRGELVEIEFSLEAESIFCISTAASVMIELLEETPEEFCKFDRKLLGQIRAVDGILSKLLAGLVPIRGEATDLSVIEIEGKQWIARNQFVELLPHDRYSHRRPLTVVGVAETRLFWKDIRRVLFSSARMRGLCRIARDGLHDDWTPLKLADVMESVTPGLTNPLSEFKAISHLSFDKMAKRSSENDPRLKQYVLERYIELLVDQYSLPTKQVNLETEVEKILCGPLDTKEEWRNAMLRLSHSLLKEGTINRDPENEVIARSQALSLLARPSQQSVGVVPGTNNQSRNDAFLDVEFVGIYW